MADSGKAETRANVSMMANKDQDCEIELLPVFIFLLSS